MSYECWRREVALGTMPEYDERSDRGNANANAHLCCVNRMVDDPPTKPHQRCRVCSSALPWYDRDDPERGFFDSDTEACIYCSTRPMDDEHEPYCSARCACQAQGDA